MATKNGTENADTLLGGKFDDRIKGFGGNGDDFIL